MAKAEQKTKKIPPKLAEWLEPEKLLLIEGWCKDGLTDIQTAEMMGITANTIYRWKRISEKFAKAFKTGKEVADRKVEESLYKSAIGHTVTVKKPMKVKTIRKKDGMAIEEEKVEYVDEEVYIPPSNTAQIFWLKNRKPDVWRDKQVVEATANGRLADLIDGLKEPVEEKDG